jgi:hypothetical protein
MNDSNAYRPLPLALAMLIALASALTALAVSGGHDAHAHGIAAHQTHAHVASAHKTRAISRSEFRLRNDMRKLWEDHVTWTRLAIISLTTASPDTQATVGRLLENQADIGNAIKPFYGRAAGNQLTALLRQHILIAADLIAAAQAGDQGKLAEAQARWQANADQIATFLSKANPRAWKLGPTRAMLREHLKLTTEEAVARLQGNWGADVAAYDKIHRQALHMADMLSAGIVEQFPRRFR